MAIIDRIKFDGMQKEWLVYRYPGESFVYGTKLIVGEGQIAVFFKGGQALDYFSAGTYTLSTENIPLLRAFVNLPYGGKTPFTAEVYFINRTSKLDINWGTVDPIQLIDPKYNIKLRIRSFGQIGMKVEDYRVFLTELIGAMNPLEVVNHAKMLNYFKGVLVMKVKSLIAQAIIHKRISALEISAAIDEISEFCKDEISGEFSRFGLRVVNFFIQSINFPDEDFEAINNILRQKAEFDIIGDQRYVTKRSFDTMETAAGNEGGVTGAMMGAGASVGAGLGMGAAFSNMAANTINTQPVRQVQAVTCPGCNRTFADAVAFCTNCGRKLSASKLLCPQCKKEVDDDARFCNHCGAALAEQKSCAKCGTANEMRAEFCKSCGSRLEG